MVIDVKIYVNGDCIYLYVYMFIKYKFKSLLIDLKRKFFKNYFFGEILIDWNLFEKKFEKLGYNYLGYFIFFFDFIVLVFNCKKIRNEVEVFEDVKLK